MSKPLITNSGWNYVELKFANKTVKYGSDDERSDLILWYDGYIKWDWKDETVFVDSHNPGISTNAVKYLIDKDCKVIIITKGYGNQTYTCDGYLKTNESVLKYIKKKNANIAVYHLKTENAVQLWNTLLNRNIKVGMLLHSTC